MDLSDRTLTGTRNRVDTSAPASRRALLRLMNVGAWAGGVERWACLRSPPAGRADVVVAVPARDESLRIERCLDACARSAMVSGLRVRLVVLVNGTDDDTAARALGWALRCRVPMTLVDVDLVPRLAHAGGARRLALDIAGLGVAPGTLLMTTDADARPAPGWIAANAMHLRVGADLVCGHVTLDPVEAARLPSRTRSVGDLEARYGRTMRELEHLLDPDPCNPWPHHGEASGASLAMRAEGLAAVGGVPLVPCGEDRALARRARALGMAVVHADEVEVEVSCRTVGRAAGGMADALRDRLHDPDPSCDEAFECADALHARFSMRARLRTLWPRTGARADALLRLGLPEAFAHVLARLEEFETAWHRLEGAAPAAARTRLRASDLRRELPRLLRLVARTRDGAAPAHGRSRRAARTGPASRAVPKLEDPT